VYHNGTRKRDNTTQNNSGNRTKLLHGRPTSLTGLFNQRHFTQKSVMLHKPSTCPTFRKSVLLKQLRNLRELAWDGFLLGLPWLIPKEVLVYFCYSLTSHPVLKNQIFAVPHPKTWPNLYWSRDIFFLRLDFARKAMNLSEIYFSLSLF